MPEDEITLDVAGQPGGPPPEVQAAVDAEQLALIERIKAEREPDEAADRARMNDKIEAAMAAQAERRSFVARIELLEARVKVLEANHGN